MKNCKICNTLFIPNSGVHKYCSTDCKHKANQTLGSMTVARQYERISGDWTRYFNRLNRRTTTRPDLTTQDLLKQLEKQNGLCALSGIPLTCQLEVGTRFKTNASIDRIESGGSYIPDNIQLVCSALNSFRSNTELSEFIWFCEQVTNHQKKEGKFICHT